MQLTQQELDSIRDFQSQFAQAKIALADAELNKQSVLASISLIKKGFEETEKFLVDKYGIDSVINIQTGEVTKK